MWDRAIMKMNAKTALRGRFWISFAVILTVSILSNIMSYLFGAKYKACYTDFLKGLHPDIIWMIPAGLISLLLAIFVSIPLTIGMTRFFVQNRFGTTQYLNVFSGFQNGYGKSVGTTVVTDIFIGLWSLLFLVPGIIKSLEYSMVRFILSDNPNIDGSRARQISRVMTDGEKGNIFVLGLSFIGWILIPTFVGEIIGIFNPILGSLVISIGTMFVYPYMNATFAELYVFLRDRAIQSGMVHPAELGLMPQQEQRPQQPQM